MGYHSGVNKAQNISSKTVIEAPSSANGLELRAL